MNTIATSPARARSTSARPATSTPPQELPDYCARPSCRRLFIKTTGPGRPQYFCSEVCRRTAEKELRQAKARLIHLEGLLEQTRADVASFVRVDTAADEPDPAETRQRAEQAVSRAAGVLTFLSNSNDPLALELRQLHDAVAPLVLP